MPRSVVYRRLVRRQWIKVALYIALGAVAILSLKNKDFDIIFSPDYPISFLAPPMIMLSFFGAIREILPIIAAYAKRKELLNGLFFVEKTDREIIQEAICYVNACKADKFDPFSE